MKIIKGLVFMFRSRGLVKGIKRLLYILKRFGMKPHKQMKFIQKYMDVILKNNVSGTFFVPSVIMSRYRASFQKLKGDHIEWGIHCDTHTDLSRLSSQQQANHIKNAINSYDDMAISFNGFRAPYLKTNKQTHEVLFNASRFNYDSSRSILWDDVVNVRPETTVWIHNFYKPVLHTIEKALPVKKDGLLELPVALPDDDILIDREALDSKAISNIWYAMLESCYQKGELFTLQLHPERINELEDVLKKIIVKAKSYDPPFWITTLNEVARWENIKNEKRWPQPYQAALCITGDIDSITLWDFIDRLVKW